MDGGNIKRFFKKATCEERRFFTSAIIPAGGNGTRMGTASESKLFIEIDGKPVIAHTLLAFQKCERVREIVIAAKKEETERFRSVAESFGIDKVTSIVPGGETRQESVFNGFSAINEKADFVCIHDGDRCLVSEEIISDVCHAAVLFGSAVACALPTDTVWIEKNGYAQTCADREHLRNAQTPQVFRADIYRAACYTAKKRSIAGTDDASLVRACGFPVKLVLCSQDNIKITYPKDISTAEAILKSGKEKAEQK